jgi:hypothetical protein
MCRVVNDDGPREAMEQVTNDYRPGTVIIRSVTWMP